MSGRRIVAHMAYPMVIAGSVLLADVLHRAGLPPGLVATLVFLIALVVTGLLERLSPRAPRWQPSRREARQDLLYLGIAALLQAPAKALGIAIAAGLVTLIGPALSSLGPSIPLAARAVLAFLLADLGKYAMHRLAHEHPWWWRFHAEHHAPPKMNVLNATRLHPVNLVWNLAIDALTPALFGLDVRVTLLLGVGRGAIAILQHANVRLELWPLSWIFSTPELHQWHHSTRLAEANANYGSSLIVWDILFGTRILPRDRSCPEALGLADGAPHPEALYEQLALPFRPPPSG